jgi:N4-gp56 family major capsid protein
MSKTVIGLNDPKAVKRYSAFLAVDVGRTSYFNKKFMGVGIEAQTPIQILPHLENDAGDQISYDLVMQLKMQPVEGDNTLAGQEEDLKFYTDSVYIDQMRGGVNTGGRMTRKRTIHDLRKVARARQGEWWARVFDELIFMYIAGCRGINADYIFPTSYAGFANNSLVDPITSGDTDHYLFAARSDNGVIPTSRTDANWVAQGSTGNNLMTLTMLERAQSRAETMGGGATGVPAIEPIMIDGEEHYVVVMHPWQAYQMRTSTSTGQWLDIQKAAAAAEGRNNPIFKGSLGMYNNIVLHTHRAVIRPNNAGTGTGYGASSNVGVARALFMGRQSGVVAFGSPGNGLRFDWQEDYEDRGNQVIISTSSIFGVKKTSFTTDGTTLAGSSGSVKRDFGVIAMDTVASDPS